MLKQLICPMLGRVASLPCSQQGRQHCLQSPYQKIGFLVAFQECRDLRIFQADLIALSTENSRGDLFEKVISWGETVPWSLVAGVPAPLA